MLSDHAAGPRRDATHGEAHLRALLDSSPDLAWSVDPADFRLLTFNAALTRYFQLQYQVEIVAGMRPEDVLPRPVAAVWLGYYERALRDGAFEVEHAGATGRVLLWLSVRLVRRGADVEGITIIGRDVTELARYRALIEHAPLGVSQRELDGRPLYANPALLRALGCHSVAELAAREQRSPPGWVRPHDVADVPRFVREQGELRGREVELRLDDGSLRTYELHAFLSVDQTVSSFFLDITQRRSALDRLRAERDLRHTVIEESPAFFVAIGADGRVRLMNASMRRALGWTLDEVVGVEYMSNFVPEADRPKLAEVFARLMSHGHSSVNVNRVVARDGRLLTCEWHGVPVFAGRDFDFFVGFGLDITERVQAEAELSRYRQHLEELVEVRTAELVAANRAKSLFLSNMSHELRTPLNVILGYAQILRGEGRTEAEWALALRRIQDAGTHLLGLIDDVLSISRAESGTLTLRPAPFAPRALVQALTGAFEAPAARRGLRLELLVHPSVPQWVETDEHKLRQVLLNLLGNAVKFTAHGHVRLTVRAEHDSLHCEVSDTGPGIPEHEVERLFQSFYQGEAGRRSAEGTGLGLYISRSLIALMGGAIACQSTPGSGTTFRFHVRAPAAAPPDAADPPFRQPRLGPGTVVPPMLVIDDRPTNCEMLRLMLAKIGFRVEVAHDGPSGLARLERETFSLVWLDMRMPGMDGAEVLARLRASERARGARPCRVVAVTASVLEMTPASARALGFDGLLGKPIRLELLVATIEPLLGVTLTAAPPPTPAPTPAPGPLSSRVAALDDALRARLLEALVAGDGEAALAALAPLRGTPVGDELSRMVEHFESDRLLQALRDAAIGGEE